MRVKESREEKDRPSRRAIESEKDILINEKNKLNDQIQINQFTIKVLNRQIASLRIQIGYLHHTIRNMPPPVVNNPPQQQETIWLLLH